MAPIGLVRVRNWPTEVIDSHWEDLFGACVLGPPRLGEDMVVLIGPPQYVVNLGRVVSVALESGSGRTFLVRTDRFGVREELFVQLADGVRATAGLPTEGVST